MRIDCTDADRDRFAAVCREVAAAPSGEYSGGREGIGVLREKRLHAVLKRFVCPDVSFHEQTPHITAGSRPESGVAVEKKQKKYVADVLCDSEIYEIQTGSLYPLREKLAWYAENTDCHVTVIHPIAEKKRMIWIDPESGEAKPSPRLSRRGRPEDILPDLVYISELAASGRVSLRLMLLEAEEYRWLDGWGRDGKRGSSRYELLPVGLLGEVHLELPEDYRDLLPDGLAGAQFTGAEFAKTMKFASRKGYLALHTLENLGVVRQCGTRGRAKMYEVI